MGIEWRAGDYERQGDGKELEILTDEIAQKSRKDRKELQIKRFFFHLSQYPRLRQH